MQKPQHLGHVIENSKCSCLISFCFSNPLYALFFLLGMTVGNSISNCFEPLWTHNFVHFKGLKKCFLQHFCKCFKICKITDCNRLFCKGFGTLPVCPVSGLIAACYKRLQYPLKLVAFFWALAFQILYPLNGSFQFIGISIRRLWIKLQNKFSALGN